MLIGKDFFWERHIGSAVISDVSHDLWPRKCKVVAGELVRILLFMAKTLGHCHFFSSSKRNYF
jgi:hypothetical protein